MLHEEPISADGLLAAVQPLCWVLLLLYLLPGLSPSPTGQGLIHECQFEREIACALAV